MPPAMAVRLGFFPLALALTLKKKFWGALALTPEEKHRRKNIFFFSGWEAYK